MKRVTIDIDEEFAIALRRRKMSDKLVYVDSIKKRLNEAYGEGNLLGLDGILSDVPTVDAVEVVRCKDCKYWIDKDGTIQKDDGTFYARCNVHNHFIHGEHYGWCPTEDDFCSYGERIKNDAAD